MRTSSGSKNVTILVSNDLITDQRLHKLAGSISSCGFTVRILGRVLKNSLDYPNSNYQIKRFQFLFNKGPWFYAEMNIRYFFYLLFSSADIYFSIDLDTLPSAWFASVFRRKRVIYDSHEYFTELPELADRPFTRKIWESIERFILPKIKYTFTVCDSISKAYEIKYGIRMKTVRNLPLQASQGSLNTNYEPDRKILLYQGSLNKGRGVELMIDAMTHLPDFKLHVIGGGDLENQLKNRVQELGITDNVLFFGKVPFTELNAYTQQASLGLSLEENLGLNYYYALPNKLFDYLQSGIPVLVSPFPEMQNIVNQFECGTLLIDRQPIALANQIKSIFEHSNQLQQWHVRCLDAAKELVWEKDVPELTNLLTQWTE